MEVSGEAKEIRDAAPDYGADADAQDVPSGYKRTDVGVIPEDWDVRSVRDLGAIRTGPFGTLLKAEEYSSTEGVPLISVGEIGSGALHISERTPRIPPRVARRLPQYTLRAGDIVFGRKGAVDRSALVADHQDGWFLGSDGISLRPKLACSARYISWQFLRREVQAWLLQNATGTTMASLNQAVLSQVRIPYAPAPEQRAIAEALSDVDGLLGALEALIVKKRAIKQAAMQQLLTGKTRLPGFSGDWETKRLGDFASIRNQKVIPSQCDPAMPCVELEHIGQADGRLITHSTATDSTSSKYRFFAGDVLFGRLRSYLRKYWLADFDGICSTEMWPLVVDPTQADSRFLLGVVQTDRFIESASISYGTHMPRADWGVMRNFEVVIPTAHEQAAIATVLSDMDAEISALEARLDKTRMIKQGKMQQLLTGRVRLVKPEAAA